QAEDGIRDDLVTGVQTCALPISYDLNVQQYCCAGLNFGYYYDRSPIIAHDGEAPPPYSMGSFTASTVPGARVPHLWLSDGRSLRSEERRVGKGARGGGAADQ